MYQAIIGGSDTSLNTGAARVGPLMGGGGWSSATVATGYQVIPTGGTISALRVKLSTAPGAGKQYVFTLYLNGAPSALTVTIAGTDTEGSDTANSIALVASDYVSILCTPTGTPAAAKARWATIWTPTTDGESICLFNTLPGAATAYCPVQSGSGAYTTTEGKVKCPMPTAGVFKKLYVKLSSDPSLGKSRTITLRLNTASSALTVTISDTDTTGSDAVNTVAVVPGNLVDMRAVATNSPDAAQVAGGLVFAAEVTGESLLFANGTTQPSQAGVKYINFAGLATWNATEANIQSLAQEISIKKMYVSLSAAPGAGAPTKSYQLDLRVNNASSGLSVIIASTATTGYHLTQTDFASVFDVMGIQCTPLNTPALTYPSVGMVLLTTPGYYPVAPTVATEAMKDVSGTTATGQGRILALNGTVSQHGHCWATTTNPTTGDSKTTNGAASSPGYFTSALTGLTGGSGYYCRAYATNEYGTNYGLNVYFIADSVIQEPVSIKRGLIKIKGETLVYGSWTAVKKTLTGT